MIRSKQDMAKESVSPSARLSFLTTPRPPALESPLPLNPPPPLPIRHLTSRVVVRCRSCSLDDRVSRDSPSYVVPCAHWYHLDLRDAREKGRALERMRTLAGCSYQYEGARLSTLSYSFTTVWYRSSTCKYTLFYILNPVSDPRVGLLKP